MPNSGAKRLMYIWVLSNSVGGAGEMLLQFGNTVRPPLSLIGEDPHGLGS
jgi:hypothetical protein